MFLTIHWCLYIIPVIGILYIYFRHSYRYWKRMGVPQLEPSFPFGDMASVIFRKQNMGDKIKEIYDKMKGHRYVGLYFFSRKAFLPLDPVLIKNILSQVFIRLLHNNKLHKLLSFMKLCINFLE